MKENPLLAMLANLTGDITLSNNNNHAEVLKLQEVVASTLIAEPTLRTSTSFQFQQLEGFSARQLNTDDLNHLNTVLQRVKEEPKAIDPSVRIFRRETPVASSQVIGSIPEWGRGAKITETIGPVTTIEGKKVWFDIYRTVPLVQVFMQGAVQPFMLLPLQAPTLLAGAAPKSYKIPKGSVWMQADKFAAASPDNLYCGLAVGNSELKLTNGVALTADNKLIIPNGTEATFIFNLEQKIDSDTSPDNNGIDVKDSEIDLPKTLTYTIKNTGSSLTAANASWKLYGQSINFTYNNAKPAIWNAELNRINIFFKASVAEFEVLQCKSNVCKVSGKASIMDAAWALSAAVININAPLQAEGTGAMLLLVKPGLEATWMGLKDANLFESSTTKLNTALIMLMPGRLNITSQTAWNPTGKQRFNLWRDIVDGVEKPMQFIDLQFTRLFFFFYDCIQKGMESVAAQANCICNIDKPVQVSGAPFNVESLQTIFAFSISKQLQVAYLYDDNIIKDNWEKKLQQKTTPAGIPLTFKSTAIALNNALLTVSPVNSFLLFGDLKSEDSFDKCVLVYGFGLLQYLPTLPDPYAANVALLRKTRNPLGSANSSEPIGYTLEQINAMLVCFMMWKNFDAPEVNFFFGDKPETPPAASSPTTTGTSFGTVSNPGLSRPTLANVREASNVSRTLANENRNLSGEAVRTASVGANIRSDIKETISLKTLHRPERLQPADQKNIETRTVLESKKWSEVTGDKQSTANMLNSDNQSMVGTNTQIARGQISPFNSAFTLLDVSTNADLMGVNLGFSNDSFVFERTQVAQEETSGNPISISGMDVFATSRLVQIYALPQISWEPVINISEKTNPATDPDPGILYFLNDGLPAHIANTGNEPVNLAPIPLTKQVTEWYNKKQNFSAWSLFTLPYGMLALAMYTKKANETPGIKLIEQKFPGDLQTGLQIQTDGYFDNQNKHKKFPGSAHQLTNSRNIFTPAAAPRSILAGSVTEIFNKEFGAETGNGFDLNKYVPLERYDFSGYGANVFSHWVNQKAAIAQTSQAMFDVWRGRTAHEVVQVKSVLYPWAIRVVRTITIYRASTGFEWRIDSGWKAESDGIYDFRSPVKVDNPPADLASAITEEAARTYKFHPGMVEGVFNVRNIKEDITLAPFERNWTKNVGVYIDDQGHPQPANNQPQNVKLVPVYFDADVQIDDVIQGATNGRVLGQRMLGYLQIAPRGVFIDAGHFADLLDEMNGLGGPVDCMVNINSSKQKMRITRVEVNPSRDAANNLVFVTAAKGSPVLPKDGSWSVVTHDLSTKEVTPLSGNDVIPLVREGLRNFNNNALTYTQEKLKAINIAHASELFKALENRAKQFGFLQSTGENKVLFRNPLFDKGIEKLKGSIPDIADAYRLMNSKGIFPKVEGLPKLDEIGDAANKFGVKIIEQGYQVLNNTVTNATQKIKQLLPEGPWYIVDTEAVKVYIEYKPTTVSGGAPSGGPTKAFLDYDLNSAANEWVNGMNDVTMVVDLGDFERLLLIRGKFDTKKGEAPSFIGPVLEFGPDLKPVVDILVLLSEISIDPNYTEILKKGLKIAMSNSPNNWDYKFQADKEIPVIHFPPKGVADAQAPLKLEASLKVGVFFNLAMALPPGAGAPSLGAGAFVEFFGKLSVMCVSVGAGTVYAVGQVTVRLSGHTVSGPGLYLKFGFGIEAVVALPVIGNVSVYFAAGVEMSLNSLELTIGAFILFRGRAEIFGGIVTVTIQIEASGKVTDRQGTAATGKTEMEAQVTFSLDISVCWVIDISFTEQWRETRQIA